MAHLTQRLRQNREKIIPLFVLGVFLLMLLAGLLAAPDYGISYDEMAQRRHSLVTYKYINETLFGREIAITDNLPLGADSTYAGVATIEMEQPLANLPEYQSRYYGTAIQMPLVLIEDLTGFTLPLGQVFLIRHIYCFLIFYVSLIFFYRLCRLLLGSRLFALLGTLLIYLYPRFFAASFYSIKDVVFSSLFCIGFYFMMSFLKGGRKTGVGVAFGMVAALATNSRVFGLLLPCALVAFMAVEDIVAALSRGKPEVARWLTARAPQKTALSYAVVFLSYFGFFTLFTPGMWTRPVGFFLETFNKFYNYEPWDGEMLFDGAVITKAQMPWYYLPKWWAVSVPLVILAFALAGVVLLFVVCIKRGWPGFVQNRLFWLAGGCFALPLAAVLLRPSLIYIEWKHLYFLFPLLVFIAVYGAKATYGWLALHGQMRLSKLVPLALCASLLYHGVWMAQNHPHENVYLNLYGKGRALDYDRDFWSLSYYQLLQYLEQNTEGEIEVLLVGPPRDILLLLGEEYDRFTFVLPQSDDGTLPAADYALFTYVSYTFDRVELLGYPEEAYAIFVDGHRVGGVYVPDGAA